MWSSTVLLSSPAVSLWRWNSGNHMPCHPFRCLPTNEKGMRPRGGRAARTVALAAAPVRWTLDDVERISRGRPSKAKTGSRAIPHRLNAEERKAFELAKKRGYVVQQANSRRYPLINTYRNYCDALGLLCTRIEQGTTGLTDQVVVDFTPLHLSEADVSSLRTEVLKAVISVSGLHDEETATFGGEVPKVEDEQVVHAKDQAGACPPNSLDEPVESLSPVESSKGTLLSDGLEESSGPLRFQASSRNMAKVISEAALDAWRRFSISKAKS